LERYYLIPGLRQQKKAKRKDTRHVGAVLFNSKSSSTEKWERVGHLPSWVISLLNMLRFDAHAYVAISRMAASLNAEDGAARRTNPHAAGTLDRQPMPDSQLKLETEAHELLKPDFHRLLLFSSEDQIDRILRTLRTGSVTWGEMTRFKSELANRVEDELKRRTFYQLKPDVSEYFETTEPFGSAVHIRFRSASHDIEEACKCYACERHDATVFHLMRAMESPLRCLAKSLHVSYSPGWAGYLNRINKKLNTPKSRLPKTRKDFLSNTSALMWAIKDAWRNNTMHLENNYGPDQTKAILQSVKAFMVHLATGLQE
jgi:hypothetical protein